MKNYIFVLFFSIGFHSISHSQVSIRYENPEIHGRNQSGEIPRHLGYLKDEGYLIVNKARSRIEMRSMINNEVKSFDVVSIDYVYPPGHYVGFGTAAGFSLIPEDNLIILVYKRHRAYNFRITESEKALLIQELKQ